MANDLNLWQGIGRLVDMPELRKAGDMSMTNFTLACGWKTASKEGTEYIRCVAYGKLAEIICEYSVKGQQLYISGRQSTRKFEDKQGVTKYSTEIIADKMQFLAKPQGAQESKPEISKPQRVENIDDDIPF
jgi:single-strand DNA-binding protein